MKKLALVLGSLLVVGTAASAKEVMPAPVVMPEKVVEIVEKPVIVYRDREVAPKWRPSGSVDVHARFFGEVEGHSLKDNDKKVTETYKKWNASTEEYTDATKDPMDSDWTGDHYRMQLRTAATVNFTEKQSLELSTRHNYGLTRQTNNKAEQERLQLMHTYKFGKLGSSMVDARVETRLRHAAGTTKSIEFKPVFDFSGYFFKNDYVKATALEVAPVYRHIWTREDEYSNVYALYANAEFELPYGVTFQAEFDNLYNYAKENATVRTAKYKAAHDGVEYDRTAQTGTVELTLVKKFDLYKDAKNSLNFELKGVYETGWSYSRKDPGSTAAAGTDREGKDKTERWGAYTAKFEPAFNYNFKATEFVNLYARLGAEYINRTDRRPDATHWRWQPTARLGFKATF